MASEREHNMAEFLGRELHSLNCFNSGDCIRCSSSLMKCSQPRPRNISNWSWCLISLSRALSCRYRHRWTYKKYYTNINLQKKKKICILPSFHLLSSSRLGWALVRGGLQVSTWSGAAMGWGHTACVLHPPSLGGLAKNLYKADCKAPLRVQLSWEGRWGSQSRSSHLCQPSISEAAPLSSHRRNLSSISPARVWSEVSRLFPFSQFLCKDLLVKGLPYLFWQ